MALTFRGGTHVKEHKNTSGCAIKHMPPPKTVTIPMSQHIGAQATPCVEVGDTVDKGQVIGIIEAGLGAPVHSSVSGKVISIDVRSGQNGALIKHVTIENDGEGRVHPDVKPWGKPLSETTPEEIVEIVKNAGISGMGGATFPTHAKISSALGKVDTIIVNCAECEPFITANHRLMLEYPETIVGGLRVLMHTFGLNEGIIAIEDNKRDAAKVLKEFLGEDTSIKIKLLKTKYPQGDERQLIYALTKKQLAAGHLPAEVGCCIFNAETCAAIHNAITTGMPLVERVVTVDGDCIKNPGNVFAPFGTTYRDLIVFCGGLTRSPRKIICGGPMMGAAQWDLETPIAKGTAALLVLSPDMEYYYEQAPICIRCGRCVQNCPMHLMPNYLTMFAKLNRLDLAEQFDILSCIECGSCSYNCPGHVSIVQRIRATKMKINDRKRAMQASLEQSKIQKEDK